VTALDAGRRDPTASVAVLDVGGFDHASIDHRFGSGATFAGATHTVGPVPPGTYQVRVTFSDGVVVERELTVDGEATRALELARP
jgi:hypothetical protein